MDTLFPKVLQAVAGEDFTVYLYFNDGSVRLYDAKPLDRPERHRSMGCDR